MGGGSRGLWEEVVQVFSGAVAALQSLESWTSVARKNRHEHR